MDMKTDHGPNNLIVISALVMVLLIDTSFLQTGERTGSQATKKPAEQVDNFIVAFELSEENGFDFVWPLESMKAAPYDVVTMVVGRMPRIRSEHGGEGQQLSSARYLKINGRTQKPYRTTTSHTYFLVRLDKGRLRLALSIPSGTILDPEYPSTTIELYEIPN
jgi:hypothetical protein